MSPLRGFDNLNNVIATKISPLRGYQADLFLNRLLVDHVERVPEKFLKHLEGTNGLYEICVKMGSDIFRLFCFFDEGRIVVVLQGFQKKSEKTPKNELERAERLKQQYFEEKEL